MISLGCPRNLIDSEVLLGHAAGDGLLVAQDPADADVVVINTCGFIESAKEESIQTILEVCKQKETGSLKGVVAVGCLTQRYGDELRQEIPELDAVLGLSDYSSVPALIRHIAAGGDERFVNDTRGGNLKSAGSDRTRLLMTPRSYAYLRIAEGCNHTCTFCAIPSIRGKVRSKPLEVVVDEARGLAESGVRELILVAEDSTAYGMDTEHRRMLAPLLEALSEIAGIEWIRVLYAYPHTVGPDLTTVLRENPKLVPYLDIPIQHISSEMLRAMKRGVKSEQVRRILDRLREEVPGIAVRTTYIVGFPGETQQDFEQLLELTRDYKFERLGVFAYSDEEGTLAHGYDGAVPEEVVDSRIDAIMQVSRANIEQRNHSLVGTELRVLVDGHFGSSEADLSAYQSVGRTYADAPDIDCSVLFRERLRSGQFVTAKITGVQEYDLIAEATDSSGGRDTR